MAFLQRATNNYFGLMPAFQQQQARVTAYLVSSSNPQINLGDVMIFTSSGIADTVAPIPAGNWLASTWVMVGVAAQFLAANAGSTAATPNSNPSQMCLIYDDPNQMFVVCDTTSFCISSTAGWGKNVGIVTSGPVGSTGAMLIGNANRSVMCLAGATTSSGTLPFKLMGLHPVEYVGGGTYSTAAGGAAGATTDVRKWLVMPNLHIYAQGTGNVGIITS